MSSAATEPKQGEKSGGEQSQRAKPEDPVYKVFQVVTATVAQALAEGSSSGPKTVSSGPKIVWLPLGEEAVPAGMRAEAKETTAIKAAIEKARVDKAGKFVAVKVEGIGEERQRKVKTEEVEEWA